MFWEFLTYFTHRDVVGILQVSWCNRSDHLRQRLEEPYTKTSWTVTSGLHSSASSSTSCVFVFRHTALK